ncbi:hypothetical protein ES703_52896 [subsurface metagenome]
MTNLGTFTDPGFDNPLNFSGELTETFAFSIDWGDGTLPDSGEATVDIAGDRGVLTEGSFDASHIYADNGTYTVTITVSDDDGGSDTKTLLVMVNNVAPMVDAGADQTANEGDVVNFSGSFILVR